jgi:hypothetical protein
MTSTHQPGVDVAGRSAEPTILPYVALVLGVLSVPGSLFTWDTSLPGEGFAWGLPPALLALAFGIAAIRSRTAARWAAIAGVVLGGAMAAMVIVWTVASLG